MDVGKFKDIAGAIQSIVVAIALCVGGVWAVYKFGLLEDVLSLDLELQAEAIGTLESGSRALLVKVIAKNNGSQYIELDLSNDPIIIQPLRKTESGSLVAIQTYKPLYHAQMGEYEKTRYVVHSQSNQPKSTRVMSFVQPIERDGLYFIRFGVPVASQHDVKLTQPYFDPAKIAKSKGARLERPLWGVSTYVAVTSTKVTSNNPLQRTPASGRR